MGMGTSTNTKHNPSANRELSAPSQAPDNQLQPQQPQLQPPEAPVAVLDDAKRNALEWLNNEKNATVSDAAEFAGVSRSTFYHWVDHDPQFRLLYLTWLQQHQRIGDGQVFAAEVASVDAICDAARHGGDLSAARF